MCLTEIFYNFGTQNEAIHNKDHSVVKTFKAVLANRLLFLIDSQIIIVMTKSYTFQSLHSPKVILFGECIHHRL